MGNVVNLGKFRKAKAKAEKQRKAGANRRKHGRTKEEKAAAKAEKAKLDAFLDGKELDAPEDEDKGPA